MDDNDEHSDTITKTMKVSMASIIAMRKIRKTIMAMKTKTRTERKRVKGKSDKVELTYKRVMLYYIRKRHNVRRTERTIPRRIMIREMTSGTQKTHRHFGASHIWLKPLCLKQFVFRSFSRNLWFLVGFLMLVFLIT